ncbi:MAG: hypothetical protein FWG67_00195 [Defluviitaleaceae bacterium]|nr:hypothetical protein [Defluviitaleaceae bacterium]
MDTVIHYKTSEFLKGILLRQNVNKSDLPIYHVDTTRLVNRAINDRNKPYVNNMIETLLQMDFAIKDYTNISGIYKDMIGISRFEELTDSIEAGNIENSEEILFFLENRKSFKEGIKRQYLLNAKAALEILKKSKINLILSILEDAMVKSYKNFDINHIKAVLYMPQEIAILHTLAQAYSTYGYLKEAKELFLIIYECINNQAIEYDNKDFLCVNICLGLVKVLTELKEYKKAFKILLSCQTTSLERCNGYKSYELAHLMANILTRKNQISRAKEYYKTSYFGYLSVGRKSESEHISMQYRKIYHEELETYELTNLSFSKMGLKSSRKGDSPDYSHIGELLKHFRFNKMSQAQLSYGICSQSNYNKLENGMIETGLYQKEWLFQRVGRYPYYYTYNFVSNEEWEVYKLKNKIDFLISRDRFESAEKLIYKVENKKFFKTGIGLQFITSAKIICSSVLTIDEQLEQFKVAINITIPKFDEKNIEDYFLSYDEIKLINRIAACYHNKKNYRKVVNITEALLSNLDKNYIDDKAKFRLYVTLLFNYCDAMLELNEYSETMSLAIKGWNLSLAYNFFIHLPKFALVIAKCYLWRNDHTSSLAYISLSYYLSLLTKSETYSEIALEFAINNFGVRFS